MRYGSMEEAAGQYLAKCLREANIEIQSVPSFSDFGGLRIMNSMEKSVTITPRNMWEGVYYFETFCDFMALIKLIKQGDAKNDLKYWFNTVKTECDEAVMTEILIHAVKSSYIKKADVADALSQIDKPHMMAEFLNETQDINDKEEFEL